MAKFIQRTVAPTEDNKYYFADNIYYKAGSGMPGCPAYAFGRLWEITGKKPKIGLLNACDWFEEAKRLGYEVGNTPKLGAVACWAGAGSNPYGHVSIVEELFADKSFRASESSSSGLFWNNGLIVSPKDNYAHPTSANHYPLQGFIYCGIDFDEEPEEKTMWRVQTGAYSQADNTINMYDRLVKDGYKPIIKQYDDLYHVQVGAYSVKNNALNKEKELASKGYPTHITTKTGTDVSVDSLRAKVDISTPATMQSDKVFRVGDKVKIKQGATDCDNRLLASFCYDRVHDIKEIRGDKAVITYNGIVIALMYQKDLNKA